MIRSIRMLAVTGIAVASIVPVAVPAIYARPPDVVGPPVFGGTPPCKVSTTQPGGSGPGAAIPFQTLMLGAPVTRTTTSFTTGGGGTSNAALEAQRKAAGLPYEPPVVDGESNTLPKTFAMERAASAAQLPYQRLPLAPSKRVAEPYGLIFAQAVSPTRGQVAALTLYIAGRPAAPPRYRLTFSGPQARGCGARTIDVYAPSMTAAAVGKLFAANWCAWPSMTACRTRAEWPRGRVLFVTSMYGKMYEYRWIDYDLLAAWRFRSGAK